MGSLLGYNFDEFFDFKSCILLLKTKSIQYTAKHLSKKGKHKNSEV